MVRNQWKLKKMQFKNLNENYIRVYDDVIPKLMCDHMIEEFEKNEDQFDKQTLKGHRSFTQITLQQYANWKPYQDNLQYAFNSCIDKYMEDCDITSKMFPEQYAYEMYRMKRYEPNGVDEFHDHVDVGNYASAKRFLVFFLYLNEPEGGETDFPQRDISVTPKAGRMLMFPPMWTHLHAGRKVTGDESKYIIGSYLHYV